MSLGTSVEGRIKKQIIEKIDALPSVAKVYGFEKLPLDQFPAVFITPAGMTGEFWTSAENMRVYSYHCKVMWPIGQDLPGQVDDRLQVAQENVGQVVDEIINAVDSDYVLGSYALVLFVDAADSTYATYNYEGGQAYGADITLNVHSQYLV